MSVYDLIILGDNQVSNMQYEAAEKKYIEAKNLASKIYFEEGRKNAVKGLEDLYALQKEEAQNAKKESEDKAKKETSSANFIAKGDKAFGAGDYETALVHYISAKQKYAELRDKPNLKMVNKKISLTQSKLEKNTEKIKEAENYVKRAAKAKETGDTVSATKLYLFAKDIYIELKDDKKAAVIQIEIDTMNMETEKEKSEVENDENPSQSEDKK